jgi:hypothetical protein
VMPSRAAASPARPSRPAALRAGRALPVVSLRLGAQAPRARVPSLPSPGARNRGQGRRQAPRLGGGERSEAPGCRRARPSSEWGTRECASTPRDRTTVPSHRAPAARTRASRKSAERSRVAFPRPRPSVLVEMLSDDELEHRLVAQTTLPSLLS